MTYYNITSLILHTRCKFSDSPGFACSDLGDIFSVDQVSKGDYTYFGEHYMTIAEVRFPLLDNPDLGICSCLSFILVELV